MLTFFLARSPDAPRTVGDMKREAETGEGENTSSRTDDKGVVLKTMVGGLHRRDRARHCALTRRHCGEREGGEGCGLEGRL